MVKETRKGSKVEETGFETSRDAGTTIDAEVTVFVILCEAERVEANDKGMALSFTDSDLCKPPVFGSNAQLETTGWGEEGAGGSSRAVLGVKAHIATAADNMDFDEGTAFLTGISNSAD